MITIYFHNNIVVKHLVSFITFLIVIIIKCSFLSTVYASTFIRQTLSSVEKSFLNSFHLKSLKAFKFSDELFWFRIQRFANWRLFTKGKTSELHSEISLRFLQTDTLHKFVRINKKDICWIHEIMQISHFPCVVISSLTLERNNFSVQFHA